MENQQKTEKKAVEEGVRKENLFLDKSSLNATKISLRGRKWTYRGEGNANVVIALPEEQKVIRLRKSSKKGNGPHGETASFSLEAKFYAKVMIPLLGSFFVKQPTIGYIDKQEILELEELLIHQRPVSRLHKGIRSVDAAIYMDYSLLPPDISSFSLHSHEVPTFCVEIKPKQGWVPKLDRQFHKCKFCLHQYLKVKKQKVDRYSQYCPLDLFSGNLRRMKKALSALLETPQNNFKIFKNGDLVYGQDISGSAWPILRDWLGDSSDSNDRKLLLEKFYYIIIEALTKDMMSFRKSREKVPYFYQIIDENSGECDLNGSVFMKFQEYDIFRRKSDIKRLVVEEEEWLPTDLLKTAEAVACQALESGKDFACQWDIQDQDKFPENCVLQRILQVQKLDSYGAEHVYREYQREKNLVGNLSDFSYIHSLMAPDAVLSSIHCYLLATVAKDCSVMLTFQKVLHSWNVGLQKHATIQCPDGQKFLFSIGVIDLEPKPLSCIERHVLRDHEVLKAYISQQAV